MRQISLDIRSLSPKLGYRHLSLHSLRSRQQGLVLTIDVINLRARDGDGLQLRYHFGLHLHHNDRVWR